MILILGYSGLLLVSIVLFIFFKRVHNTIAMHYDLGFDTFAKVKQEEDKEELNMSTIILNNIEMIDNYKNGNISKDELVNKLLDGMKTESTSKKIGKKIPNFKGINFYHTVFSFKKIKRENFVDKELMDYLNK